MQYCAANLVDDSILHFIWNSLFYPYSTKATRNENPSWNDRLEELEMFSLGQKKKTGIYVVPLTT